MLAFPLLSCLCLAFLSTAAGQNAESSPEDASEDSRLIAKLRKIEKTMLDKMDVIQNTCQSS